MKPFFTSLFLVLSFLLNIHPLSAQENLLGEIDFPNSGSDTAQEDFIEGVLFLHNFEYEDAARAFRRAQKKDPDFALAYWGEAMTYNHPIWMDQDQAQAQEVLERFGNSVEERQAKTPTQREKDYLMTVEQLFGNTPESEGKSKMERDFMYRDAMQSLHKKYPDDHEAAAFYGLSILGTAHQGRDYAIYMRAAAELMSVWEENQKHPGAAHYLIHSFDDPVHAPLGLPMARVYSEIAPAAAHAQHMTSHIFLALGMWEDVIDANIVARNVQTSRQKELNESTTVCGHYPWWLQYGYLQEGKTEEAEQVLNRCMQRIEENATSNELWHFAIMRAHQIVDAEQWEDADYYSFEFTPQTSGARNYFFSTGYASVLSGKVEEGYKHLNSLMLAEEGVEKDIQVKQLKSLILIENGNHEDGLQMLKTAVADEAELPIDFGPPTIVKPSLELLGDVLMKLDRSDQAIEAYNKQLERTPNRRRTRIGLDQVSELTLH